MTEELDMIRISQHIAVIMDGNGRWTAEYDRPRSYGHQAGVDTVHHVTSECVRLGVKSLTLYIFSTGNRNRPTGGITALMGLVFTSLEDEIFVKNNVCFHVTGDIARLPEGVQKKLCGTEECTAKNLVMTMVAALSYSVHWGTAKVMREIAVEHRVNSPKPLYPETIIEEMISERLEINFTSGPGFLTGTGGEPRILNYLLWQTAYSELYFRNTRWPDLDEQDLQKAIVGFQSRQRRFGKIEKQVEENENN